MYNGDTTLPAVVPLFHTEPPCLAFSEGEIMTALRVCSVTLAVLILTNSTGAATITIDDQTEYQEVDGFGFFGGKNVNWCGGKPGCLGVGDDAWFDRVINDLGMTITRNEYYSQEPNQDANWSQLKPFHQALKAKADASGVNLKFFCSYWTPPSKWKSNHSLKNGGRLLPQYYDEFGNWAKQTIQDYKNAGIDLYALSLQNEPAFEEPYNSCVYSYTEYRDMLKVAGPIIHGAFPNTKLVMPEDVSSFARLRGYMLASARDPEALKHIGVFATHGYGGDGVTASSTTAGAWEALYDIAQTYDRKLWMTETSGYGDGWSGAFSLAGSIFAALKYGKISAWVYWYMDKHIVGLNKKYYVSKQYFRYIRPGAIHLAAASDDDAVQAVAFKHESKRTLTVVLINTASGSKSVTLSGNDLPGFECYVTTGSGDNASKKSNVTTSVTLPGNSITTLYGTNYDAPSVGIRARASDRYAVPARQAGREMVYGIDGRAVGSTDQNLARGAYYRIATGADGRALACKRLMQIR